MNRQNFVVIGAAKSGTTSLYNYIKQHPQVYMPAKETNFFRRNTFIKEALQNGSNGYNITDVYNTFLDGATIESAVGEICPAYMYDPEVTAKLIYDCIPDAKIIAILRHPVDRAYSNYLHTRLLGWENASSFRQALKNEEQIYIPNRKKPEYKKFDYFAYYYKTSGFYYKKLKPYFDLFNKDQIKIYTTEELHKQPIVLLKDLFCHLGVDNNYPIDVSKKSNFSGTPKSELLGKVAFRKNKFKSVVKYLIPKKLRYNLKKRLVIREPIPSDLRKSLLLEYQDDIIKLEKLIERDLSHWLELDNLQKV